MWKAIRQLINKPSHLKITERLEQRDVNLLVTSYEKQHDTFFFFLKKHVFN